MATSFLNYVPISKYLNNKYELVYYQNFHIWLFFWNDAIQTWKMMMMDEIYSNIDCSSSLLLLLITYVICNGASWSDTKLVIPQVCVCPTAHRKAAVSTKLFVHFYYTAYVSRRGISTVIPQVTRI